MPFNGSGTFVRLYNWVNDKASNIKIRADRMDNEMNGMATALSTCLTKDGQTTVTANLPMANYRHTSVGNAANRNEYAAFGQVQDGVAAWAVAGGTADAITASYYIPVTTLVDGQLCFVRAGAANATTPPTFSPNGLTARTIVKNGGAALVAGDISGAGHQLILRYDLANTRWELLNPKQQAFTGGTLTSTLTMSGVAINEAATVDVASATTCDIGAAASNTVRITGTTTITGFGTVAAGVRRSGYFAAALTLTHSATSLILPGGANITTAANDRFQALSLGSGNWIVLAYERASGQALVSTPIPQLLLSGFLSTSQTFTSSTVANMSFTSGQATDSTGAVLLSGSGLAWNITNGNAVNGYQGGTTLPNSSTIHFYVIARTTDSTWTNTFASTSLTPTLPAGFAYYRRVFSIRTNGSGVLLAGTMFDSEGGSRTYYYSSAITDVSLSTLGTSRTNYALSVPSGTGLRVRPVLMTGTSSANAIIFSSPESADITPSTVMCNIDNINGNTGSGGFFYFSTDTSGQIAARSAGASTNLVINTIGYLDFMRV